MYHRRHPLRSHEQDSVTKTYSRFLTGAKTGEDGLTYKESTFSARPSSIWTTIEKRPAPWDLVVTDDRADGTGAHSLMYLVRKVINQSLDTLSLDALHLTPYDPWGFWIWTDALATKKDTLPTWALFATAYPGEELGSRAYNLPPSSRLPVLIGVLARNASFGWLVKLSFSLSETISDSDLRALPGISNLQTLCVSRGCGGTEVDDGIVRSWCRAAVQSAGFSRLRVLRLRGCGRVTSNVLVYTEWVRGLRWLDLTGCHGSVVCDPGNGWELVGVEVYKADRREWKKREEVAGVRPVVKIKLGVYNKAGGDREVRFVRRRDEAGTASVKRKAGDTVPQKKKVGAVVRRKRMKDMGDLLAEFQNPRKQ